MSDIAKNIKSLRKKNKISQEELAGKLYVTRQTISNYENGKSNPDIETLQQLAEVFGTDIDSMIYGERKRVSNKYIIQTSVLLAISLILVVMLYMFIDRVNSTPYMSSGKHVIELIEVIHCNPPLLPVGLFAIGVFVVRLIIQIAAGKPLEFMYKKIVHYFSLVFIITYVIFMLPYMIGFAGAAINRFRFLNAITSDSDYSYTVDFGEFLNRVYFHYSVVWYPKYKYLFFVLSMILGCLFSLTSTIKKQIVKEKV
jgi:transcriptional regulator with XRE-family HTH domain